MPTILIVEDDKSLNSGIALSLDKFTCKKAYSLAEAREMLDKTVSLIILDINLPDGSGLDFCCEVREAYKIPVIFLTANDMELDEVSGLESGADDYITKPFSLAILRARVNAVLRRYEKEGNVFKKDRFLFDFDAMQFYCDGNAVELSKTEQKLLSILVKNIGVTVPREKLLDFIWPVGGEFVEDNALSVTVRRLREMLPKAPIKTVYAIGYMWEA